MFFFFKQKTAYEMRISDWSSDVCSSDLGEMRFVQGIVYRADGSVKSSYTMPSEADIYAQANAGETAYPVPLGTLGSLPYALTALRDQKKQEINDAAAEYGPGVEAARMSADRKSTRLNSSK